MRSAATDERRAAARWARRSEAAGFGGVVITVTLGGDVTAGTIIARSNFYLHRVSRARAPPRGRTLY
eukprot:SAG31_NODE_1820_length_7198_cov_3.163122_2_plen_67_part_00